MSKEKLIYIADDDDNIRQAIETFLRNEGYRVEGFATGDLMLERFRQSPCDLLILDVMMPGTDGFEVCRRIRETSIVPIIMLTARDSDIDYAMGLSLGSDDYFTKPFSVVALSMRVKAILRRVEFERQRNSDGPPAAVLTLDGLQIDDRRRQATADGRDLALTPNEYDFLKYLAERAGEAVSREELLEGVWGYQTEAESRATDDTVRRLRKKLEGTAVVIETVWGFGFRLRKG